MKKILKINPLYFIILMIFMYFVCSTFMCGNVYSTTPSPVLFFSDLDSGPKTGWEGSSIKGAAVTIWGKNFGTTRGSNYVTVNGAQITEYAEWGVRGTANGIPRGLERITFWLNNSCQDGNGTITVTVNGVTSNTLPFTVRSGNIYFISVSTGNNSNNGRYSTNQGSGNGPWKTMKMALKSNNTVITPGDTIYVRGGTYTEQDKDNAFMRGRGDFGIAGKPIAVVGYPGDSLPIMNFSGMSGTLRGVFSMEIGTYNGQYAPNLGHGADYFTFAKLSPRNGADAFWVWGNGVRIIGNHIKNNNRGAWSGVVMVMVSDNARIYGNYFDHNGYDMYQHDIYIKTHDWTAVGSMKEAKNVYIGWNEFDGWTGNLNPDSYTKPPRGGCIEMQTESTAKAIGRKTHDVWVHDNYFHDGDTEAVRGDDIYPLYIYNNVFSNINAWLGAVFVNPAGQQYVYNNTFYGINSPQKQYGIVTAVWGNNTVTLKNNILHSSGQTYLYNETGSNISSTNDLFYGKGAPTSGGGINLTNPIVADPQLVNPANGDFHLSSTSPAKDAGTSAVSSVVTKDYDNIPRPQGSAYDIGAYEYTSGNLPPPSDTQAPSVPTGLVATAVSSTQINLSWNASTDNVGVTGYRIYRNGSSIGTSTTTSYSDTGLSASTTYTYTVAAYDAAANISGQSTPVSATTLASSSTKSSLTVKKELEIQGTLKANGSVKDMSASRSKPGLVCGNSCTEITVTYTKGTVVTLKATPDVKSIFAGWKDGPCTGNGLCVITINTDTTITAVFTLKQQNGGSRRSK